MQPEPTSILFQTRIEFLPMEEKRFGEAFVRGLYFRLCQPGGRQYRNLDLQSSPPRLSTTRMTDEGKSVSECQVRPHSILIEEDGPSVGVDDFIETVRTVIRAAEETGETLQRSVPPIVLQRTRIQCVAKPSNTESLDLLAGRVSSVLGKILPFRRPPMHFGVRFQFGPHQPESDDEWSDQSDDFMMLRLETWAKDPEYIWMEAASTSVLVRDRPTAENGTELEEADRLTNNIQRTYDFLLGNGIGFLEQFDTDTDNTDNDGEEHAPERDS